MKTILKQLKLFIQQQPKGYVITLMLIGAVSVYCNYHFGIEDQIYEFGKMQRFFAFAGLYAFHFYLAYLLYSIFTGNFSFWKKPGFLFLLLAAPLIFSLRSSSDLHFKYIYEYSDDNNALLNGFLFNDIFRGLYLSVPVIIMWFICDRKNQPLYGFSDKNHNYKLYWMMLLCMVPLIAAASTQTDFLNYYPKLNHINRYDPDAGTGTKVLYELIYGTDFISIELFFRGFLVLAFMRYVGMACILPMAFFYLSIHYGKPAGEAISSFFGGSLLGVIAFYSRSIFGGVMVHVGIAWMMEAGGIIGNYFRE